MTFATVCSGIGAPEQAVQSLGWHQSFCAEIEPFPSAVLETRFPGVPNYGDITKFKEWPTHFFDLLIGGTPCQSFSVAGLRKGLADPRGNLALTFLAIAQRYAPAWIVWENVPGVLSSNEGRDFGDFLGGLAELGYGFAYRVLDAQYFGVPQRRRRVFVVGHLGDWRRTAAVLFERESMCGDFAPRKETGERVAPTISARTKGDGGLGTDFDCDGGLIAYGGNNTAGPIDQATACNSHSGRYDFDSETLVAFQASQSGTRTGNVHATLDGHNDSRRHAGVISNGVRRLTPKEAERLQGFPDDFTLIQFRGKPASDSARYKAIGNSMAVPVVRWICERLKAAELIKP